MLIHFFISSIIFHFVLSICPEGSIPYSTNSSLCFSFHYLEKKNFIEAEGICIGLNGHLASVHSMFENMFISENAATNFTNADFWVGANKDLNPGIWSWMDGTSFDFEDWSKGEPQNISDNHCAVVSTQNAQWFADACYEYKPFVCLFLTQSTATTSKKSTLNIISTTTTTLPISCRFGWTYYKTTGYCYNVFQAPYNWLQAEDYCKIDGAHLASIHSQNEALFLANLAAYSNPHDCDSNVALVGFHTEDNNTHWSWTDGTPFDFPNWSPGNPDLPNDENCGAIYLSPMCGYKAGQFNNVRCTYAATRFICKMKPF